MHSIYQKYSHHGDNRHLLSLYSRKLGKQLRGGNEAQSKQAYLCSKSFKVKLLCWCYGCKAKCNGSTWRVAPALFRGTTAVIDSLLTSLGLLNKNLFTEHRSRRVNQSFHPIRLYKKPYHVVQWQDKRISPNPFHRCSSWFGSMPTQLMSEPKVLDLYQLYADQQILQYLDIHVFSFLNFDLKI